MNVIEFANATLAISVLRLVLKVTIVGSIRSFIFGCSARKVTCSVDNMIWYSSQGRYIKKRIPVSTRFLPCRAIAAHAELWSVAFVAGA